LKRSTGAPSRPRRSCTNFDKLLLFHKDGSYKVTSIPDKHYFEDIAWVEIADKKTIINVVYKQKQTGHIFGKRFIVDKFILDKTYRYLDENSELLLISTNPEASIDVHPKGRKKGKPVHFALKEIPVKGAHTRGVRLQPPAKKK
jgi:topoisomerase-4 subunit A